MIKKIIIVVFLSISLESFAKDITDNESTILDSAINNIWTRNADQHYSFQDIGPEILGNQNNKIIAPVLAPARHRLHVPGVEEILIPIEATDGPLNLSPNDTKAYILYNRATVAFHKKQYEKARALYRDLIRQYPDSSYTAYSLYTLSISEPDYRRKIRILLTIKEKFPDFSHMNLILDRLGDLYYLLDSIAAADEVFALSKSGYALYMRAMLALDMQRPGKAVAYIRSLLKNISDNELAYQAYMVYAEALIFLKEYNHALTVLKKSVILRPWAYDNGALVLFNAGKALFFNNQLNEALYVFSLLRLRFSRSTESRIADQYIVSLSHKNIIDMKTVPWLAKSFETLIKEQPVVRLRTPRYPTMSEVLQMNKHLPHSAVSEPNLDDVAFLPHMTKPSQGVTQSVLVPIDNQIPQTKVDFITFTNTTIQDITNIIYHVETNRIFSIETNTITNNFIGVDLAFVTNIIDQTNMIKVWETNTIFQTNIIKVWETNTVMFYEPVVVWHTNKKHINMTNYSTNIINHIVTNERVELLPLWRTNYNLIDRDQAITNIIHRIITNKILEIKLDNTSNWIDQVLTNRFLEVIPPWKTTYRALESDMVTNIVKEIVTNQQFHIVPRSKGKTQIEDYYEIIDTIITNTKLRVSPYWVTNFQMVSTNILDFVTTNLIPSITEITNKMLVPGAPVPKSEVAPIQIQDSTIPFESPQMDYLSDPIYEEVEEDQLLSVTPEVMKLEKQVARFAEQAAGAIGNYSIPDNKGYVVRIAQVKDLSVANIIIQDISKLNFGISPGIYYRDELYYVEARHITDYELAQISSQELYKIGYTDIQIFEQFEITEYEE